MAVWRSWHTIRTQNSKRTFAILPMNMPCGVVAMRIGGEFYQPKFEDNPVQAEARKQFLLAIKKLCPQVLISLRELRESDPRCRDPYLLNGCILVLAGLPPREPERPGPYQADDEYRMAAPFKPMKAERLQEMEKLRNTLTAWAAANHLPTDGWVLQVAADTLLWWEGLPEDYSGNLDWKYPDINLKSPASPQPVFTLNTTWYPGEETKGEAKRRLMRMLEDALEQYLDDMEKTVQAEGWLTTPGKRNRHGDPLLHFEWLVRYQVQRWTCERIAEEYGGEKQELDPASVNQAISETAMLVGLTLAPLPKGRKRKA